MRRAVAAEIEDARRHGFDVAGEAVDGHGRRFLVHRKPSGELQVVEPLDPLPSAQPESA